MIILIFKTLIVVSVVWFIVRNLIPYFFRQNEKKIQNETNFQSLILQKKMELQKNQEAESLNKDVNSSLLSTHKNIFLNYIEKNFNEHLDFYKKLDSVSSWQQTYFEDDLKNINSSLPSFSISYNEVKDVIMKQNWDRLHRGDFKKVLLLTWYYKFFITLSFDRPLPVNMDIKNDFSSNAYWRWALLFLTSSDHSWQKMIFDNLSILQEGRNEILSDANASKFLSNPAIWWNKMENIAYEISKCDEISDEEISQIKSKTAEKAFKKNQLKKYHPDSFMWELIFSDYKKLYETRLNINFSKINSLFN